MSGWGAFWAQMADTMHAARVDEENKRYYKNREMNTNIWNQVHYDYMLNQIQHQVADAKKAGIHPLYAMGKSGYSAPIATVGGGPERVRDLNFRGLYDAFAQAKQQDQRDELHDAQIDEINSRSNLNNARRDNIRAQAENSQKALQNQHHMSNRDEIYIELGPDEVPKSAKRSQNSGPRDRDERY